MKIRVILALILIISFAYFGIKKYNESTEVTSIAQWKTGEEIRGIQVRAFDSLPISYRNNIADIYESQVLSFKSGSEHIIKNNGKKKDIKQIQTTLVIFSSKDETNEIHYEIYLDEKGEEFLGMKIRKGR